MSENTAHDIITNNILYSFLNRAALITDGDTIGADGSVARPWHVYTVQQVEDFKTVQHILPLWSSTIFLSIALGMQTNFTILQALAWTAPSAVSPSPQDPWLSAASSPWSSPSAYSTAFSSDSSSAPPGTIQRRCSASAPAT